MKQLLTIIFPYKLYLHIFQLERYDSKRFFMWLRLHWWVRSNQNKKPLVYTQKVQILRAVSMAWLVLTLLIAVWTGWVGWILVGIMIVQPYLLILLAIFSLKPYEIYNRARIIRNTRRKIASLRHTQVIGIAGSYGKTSVKDISFHILKHQFRVIKTPLSYNTIFGIAQVVDLEIDDSHDYFLCELGEFQPGEVIEMCEMVMPRYGIMTGINDQHLERFKKIERTIGTIFELADYLQRSGRRVIANGANAYINQEISMRTATDFIVYSTDSSDVRVSDVVVSDLGTSFCIEYRGMQYTATTPLLGYAHLNNILGAVTLAIELGVTMEVIVQALQTIPAVPHRFEQRVLENELLLIDNSYSSNSDSFRESMNILGGLSRKYKILVTPGMVEIGDTSDQVHANMGALADQVCTSVVLVGDSDRTRAIASRVSPDKIIWMNDIRDLWKTIESIGCNPSETVVLLENDLSDNY